jgi:4a-hydroxytetrahydrobiopterin dehydratase
VTAASDSFADRRCVPCEGGVRPLGADEARTALARLHTGWQLNAASTELSREFRFKDFYRVMSFANAIAHIANSEDHHPDLELGYNYCRVRYTTHAIKGLSENDFICAAKIDRL